MRRPHSLATSLHAMLLMAASVSAVNRRNFEFEPNLDRQKLTEYLTSVLCSIDLKYANIYFEFESAGEFLDGIAAESSKCVSPTLTIITYKKEGYNVPTNTSDGAHLIILIAREFDFEKSMFPHLLRIRRKWNFELFYMIVSEVKMSANHENLLKIIYKNYNLLNAVVVAATGDNSSDPTVITYNPFTNTTIRIPNNAYNKNQLFIDKNSNIFGSPINIVTYKDVVSRLTNEQSKILNLNYDILLPNLISSALNATLTLKYPSFSEESKHSDIGTVDLTINGRSYESKVMLGTGIEGTIIVRRDDICLLLGYHRNRNTFEIIYRAVDPFVWVLMVAVIFYSWISLLVIRWTQSLFQRRKTWHRVLLLHLLGFHMNQGLKHMSKKVAPRLIIASCLLYCLVIKSIFECLLYTSLAKIKDSRISTIDELLQSDEHQILISSPFYNISAHAIDESPIKNRFKTVTFAQYMQLIDSNQIQYAYVLRGRLARYIENTKIVRGVPVYYILDEPVQPFVVRYFVRQRSPFLERINQVLRISEESGIFNYWEGQLGNAYKTLKLNQRLFVHRSAITAEHLVFVFEALLYGLAIATTVFVFEWYASRYKAGSKNWLMIKWFLCRRMQVK